MLEICTLSLTGPVLYRYERVVQCSDSIIHDTFSIVFNEQGGGGGGGGSVRVQHEITGQNCVPQFVCNCGKW